MAEDRPTPPVPQQPLDRAALERVLARAAELQASAADTGEMMTADRLLEVGKEVGISPDFMRQALAEELSRSGLPDDEGVVSRMFGSGVVSASRTVEGTPESVMTALDAWMSNEECLQVKRHFPDRTVWEREPGFLTGMRRALNVGGRGYHLARAHEVSAAVVAVDEHRTFVRLDADVSNIRNQFVASGGVMAGVNVVGAGVLLVLGVIPVVALAPALLGTGLGYGIARGHRGTTERVRVALEQVLDRLERGDAPRQSLLSKLATSARVIRIDI